MTRGVTSTNNSGRLLGDKKNQRSLVSTITGTNIQYGGSRKQQKYKDKSFESLELADVII